MAKTHLVVFVHGWGAGRDDWWGSTVSAFRNDAAFEPVAFYFHRYDTQQAPQIHMVQRVAELFGREKHQELGELGQHLWTNIKYQVQTHSYESVAFFGHSFGGLVVADAIRYGVRRQSEGSPDDTLMLKAVSAVALCCTPIGGADLAKTYRTIAKFVGKNVHIDNLLKNSATRQEVVNGFVSYLVIGKVPLTVFRAAGDGIVLAKEVYGPFAEAKLQFNDPVLDGSHSECVQNIGPFDGGTKANFHKIASWIRDRTPNSKSPPGDSHRLRESFNFLMLGLNSQLSEEPFQSWRALRKSSEVKDDYLLRIFLQQLIYAAARIDEHALGSANLWVAHYDAIGVLHLRSEEREGYFATNQLVVYAGQYAAGQTSVTIRANEVHDDPSREGKNSAGALAYLRGTPQFVAISRTNFPSESDRKLGITHVLGIPLYSRADLRDLDPKDVEGAPFAATIDFHFDPEPKEAEVTTLLQGARSVTDVFRALHNIWPAGGVRLKLQ